MSASNNKNSKPFLFPQAHSTVLPNPSKFFSPNLLSTPLPTNSFFQNFSLKNGHQPEYIHPYLIKSSNSSLSVSYPSLSSNSKVVSQVFKPDLTITSSSQVQIVQQQFNTFLPQFVNNAMNVLSSLREPHKISSYSDLSVTLDMPSSNLRFFLVRGSPFLTFSVTQPTHLSITTIHAIRYFSSDNNLKKHTFHFSNGQRWILYASSPIRLSHRLSEISSVAFSGVIRIALLPDSKPKSKAVLDRFSSCYPLSGDAVFQEPFGVEYKFKKKGSGDLLMLAHPLHVQLLAKKDCNVTVLSDFKYKSIDGELVGVVGDSWLLKTDPVSVTWHSSKGVKEESRDEIVSSLLKDVKHLNSSKITTNCSYFYGKLIARAARLALIAEEVNQFDIIPDVKKYLKETIEPWLDGTFNGNGFLYDKKWGGIITKQGSINAYANFGFGMYNDHHYQLGYFLYGIAVLAKIDPIWGAKYKPQAYSLMADFMTLSKNSNSKYTRLRCFDLYKLHSWAGGLTEFADGRNQESTSEAVNAYYSAALIGMVYDDAELVATASTLTSLEILAAKMWWHVKEGENMYEKVFSEKNKVVGVLWSNKGDSGLWFGPSEWKECRLGIQLLPILPISEVLFSNVKYVKGLVEWTLPALKRNGVGEGWKGFVYALQGVYDNEGALEKIRKLKGFDDGNSFTNLLWWIHSRGDGVENEVFFECLNDLTICE
ncbi:glucan endo-1,3-beta-D-glucosidase 1-like [Vicia villosa]|uniref:glucan endo-1,3-beta-D-glucosidase 1-like n=1 Tax=Vicia villosa TaxID=3911 RepID=UPI00273BEB9F|nr:glucan endo-1,3-beta-D-glucosidase 1-like [Vicia villosa]